MGIRRLRLVALLLVIVALFTGCLSTDTAVTLRENGSGSIELVYAIDTPAWDTGVFDDSNVARPVPITRNEFEEAALQIDGLQLRSYREERDESTMTISARLDFASTDALLRFLGSGTTEIDLRKRSWRQTVARADGSASKQAAALAGSLAGYTLDFSLTPPGSVTSTNGTIENGGRTARFTVSLAAIATAREEIVWEVRW